MLCQIHSEQSISSTRLNSNTEFNSGGGGGVLQSKDLNRGSIKLGGTIYTTCNPSYSTKYICLIYGTH